MCELLQNEGEQGGGSGRSRQESEDNAHWAASILSGGSARGRPVRAPPPPPTPPFLTPLGPCTRSTACPRLLT